MIRLGKNRSGSGIVCEQDLSILTLKINDDETKEKCQSRADQAYYSCSRSSDVQAKGFSKPSITDGLHPRSVHAAKRSLTFPKSRSLDRLGSAKSRRSLWLLYSEKCSTAPAVTFGLEAYTSHLRVATCSDNTTNVTSAFTSGGHPGVHTQSTDSGETT